MRPKALWFLLIALALLLVVAGLAAAPFFVRPGFVAACTAEAEEELLEVYKLRVLVLGLVAAVLAAGFYFVMLRLQILFPVPDVVRMGIALVTGVGSGLVLAYAWYKAAPVCLGAALGPLSSVPRLTYRLYSVSGQLLRVPYQLTMFLDYLLYVLIALMLTRLCRALYLRS